MRMLKNGLMGSAALALLVACGEVEETSPEVTESTLETEPLPEEWRQKIEIANALQADDCESVGAILENASPSEFKFQRAVLKIEGRCADPDPAAAADLLSGELSRSLYRYLVAARLGALYETGAGVQKDAAKATELYRLAIAEMGYEFLFLEWSRVADAEEAAQREELDAICAGSDREFWCDDYERSPQPVSGGPPIDADFAQIWGLASQDMLLGFVDAATGPWSLPPQLSAEVDWLQDVELRGGQAILDAARLIKNGDKGFQKDPELALRWLHFSADAGHIPAVKEQIRWVYEPGVCDAGEPACQAAKMHAQFDLTRLAREGDREALQSVIRCLPQVDPSLQFRELHLSWYLRAQRLGLDVDEDQVKKARSGLTLEEQAVAAEIAAGDGELSPVILGDTACPLIADA